MLLEVDRDALMTDTHTALADGMLQNLLDKKTLRNAAIEALLGSKYFDRLTTADLLIDGEII